MASAREVLSHLESLGDATRFAAQILELIPHSPMLENFSAAEIRQLAQFMTVYRARAGTDVIREGEGGDFMLLVIEGRFQVLKADAHGVLQPIAVVDPGRTLGEMSMIDGEPRFATCEALDQVVLAVLDRDSLARIIVEHPMLGAKLLLQLVVMLSQRLRATSSQLIGLLDERDRRTSEARGLP